MVIGANIEYGMIFAVVPADVFGIGFDKGEKAFVFVTQGLAFLYLGKTVQLRDTTAWAFRNSKEEVAFISEEMTLIR